MMVYEYIEFIFKLDVTFAKFSNLKNNHSSSQRRNQTDYFIQLKDQMRKFMKVGNWIFFKIFVLN